MFIMKHNDQVMSVPRRFVTRDISIPPVPDFDPAAIKRLREQLQISQVMLANILNTSLSTVRQWEVGDKRPGGTSAKLLDILQRKGIEGLS
jgi:putative transcriptional regulator